MPKVMDECETCESQVCGPHQLRAAILVRLILENEKRIKVKHDTVVAAQVAVFPELLNVALMRLVVFNEVGL